MKKMTKTLKTAAVRTAFEKLDWNDKVAVRRMSQKAALAFDITERGAIELIGKLGMAICGKEIPGNV